MANITKIKAKEHKDDKKTVEDAPSKPENQKPDKKAAKLAKKTNQPAKKPLPKALKVILAPFILISKPFRALGRYIASSWKEIRQVRWPNRKLTWKMTLAVVAYTALFIIIISALDALFTLIFNTLIG
jgi:preprotein translocase SecE subunit